MVQMEGAKCIMTRGPTCAKGQPNRAKMGMGRSAQAGRPSRFRGRFGPPFLEREDVSTLSTWRRRHLQRERDIRLIGRPQDRERERETEREREEEGDHSQGGSLDSKDATTSGGGRRGPAKTPPEEKEDTVGSVT
jgi:hypothetical protein